VVSNPEWGETRLQCCTRSLPGPDGLAHGADCSSRHDQHDNWKKKQSFTDLDFADDVALLVEMLSVLLLALKVTETEARPLGLTINWGKTKIQYLGDLDEDIQHATVQGNQVDVVESFTYLGSLIYCSGSSEPEIKQQANFVREAMFMLDQNI